MSDYDLFYALVGDTQHNFCTRMPSTEVTEYVPHGIHTLRGTADEAALLLSGAVEVVALAGVHVYPGRRRVAVDHRVLGTAAGLAARLYAPSAAGDSAALVPARTLEVVAAARVWQRERDEPPAVERRRRRAPAALLPGGLGDGIDTAQVAGDGTALLSARTVVVVAEAFVVW